MKVAAAALPRRALISAAIAAAVAVVVSTLVICYGVVPVPSFPSLARQPDAKLTGFVAFQNLVEDGDDDATRRVCVEVVPAGGGARRRLHCEDGSRYSHRAFQWTPDGRLAVQAQLPDGDTEIKLVDPRDGKVVQRFPRVSSSQFEPTFGRGRTRFETSRNDDRAEVSRRTADGRATKLISVKAPESYRFLGAELSPDGAYLVITDSDRRILIANADGSKVRVLTTRGESSSGNPQWFQPGRREGTITVDELLGRSPRR